MKDIKGAEVAMRESEEAWKGKEGGQTEQFRFGPPQSAGAMAVPGQFNFGQGSSPLGHHSQHVVTMMPMHPMSATAPSGRQMYAPLMMSHSPMIMMNSPMILSNASPPSHQMMQHPHPTMTPQHSTHHAKVALSSAPAHPLAADQDLLIPKSIQAGRRKKKTSPIVEPRAPYFGNEVRQSRSTVLKVFSFLDSNELFHASIVSKSWNEVVRSRRG
jgi:hypothetical protein